MLAIYIPTAYRIFVLSRAIHIVFANWFDCEVSWLCVAFQGGLEASGIGQGGGKENVIPAPKPRHPQVPRARKVSVVVVVFGTSVGAYRHGAS